MVEPGAEYKQVREALRAELAGVTDPQSGERIIEHVYRREDIYSGPHLEQAPDLLLEFVEDRYLTSRYFLPSGEKAHPLAASHFAAPRFGEVGQHHRDGILVLRGPVFEQRKNLSDARLVDMAPTLLYACGAPIPSDMDGQVLLAAFRQRFVRQHPPQRQEVSGLGPAGRSALSDQENELVYRRLRDLGYLR